MTKPMFSIIIPTFNSAATIGRCMRSVAEQRFPEYEVIVMDGGSVDDTVSIVSSFSESIQHLLVVSEKDAGVYDAINHGIRKASGSWIYVLGSDDRLHDRDVLNKIEMVVRKTTASVVYGNVLVEGDAGWAMDGEIHAGEFTLDMLLQRNICQQAVFYRNTLFERIGNFNIRYKVCADWDFMLHCAAVSRLEFCPVVVAGFQGGGLSSSQAEREFYSELPFNLFRYFGLRILSKPFRVAAWRFRTGSEKCRAEGQLWAAFVMRIALWKHRV